MWPGRAFVSAWWRLSRLLFVDYGHISVEGRMMRIRVHKESFLNFDVFLIVLGAVNIF